MGDETLWSFLQSLNWYVTVYVVSVDFTDVICRMRQLSFMHGAERYNKQVNLTASPSKPQHYTYSYHIRYIQVKTRMSNRHVTVSFD